MLIKNNPIRKQKALFPSMSRLLPQDFLALRKFCHMSAVVNKLWLQEFRSAWWGAEKPGGYRRWWTWQREKHLGSTVEIDVTIWHASPSNDPITPLSYLLPRLSTDGIQYIFDWFFLWHSPGFKQMETEGVCFVRGVCQGGAQRRREKFLRTDYLWHVCLGWNWGVSC